MTWWDAAHLVPLLLLARVAWMLSHQRRDGRRRWRRDWARARHGLRVCAVAAPLLLGHAALYVAGAPGWAQAAGTSAVVVAGYGWMLTAVRQAGRAGWWGGSAYPGSDVGARQR